MKNKQTNKKGNNLPKGRETREDKKIDLPRHKYPNPAEQDTQLKNQPEFIEPRGSKKDS